MAVEPPQLEAAFAIARKLIKRDRTVNAEQWLDALAAEGIPVSKVDLDGVAIPLSPEEINEMLKEIIIPDQNKGEKE